MQHRTTIKELEYVVRDMREEVERYESLVERKFPKAKGLLDRYKRAIFFLELVVADRVER